MASCQSLFSSVVEHQSRKLGAVGSNPTGGNICFDCGKGQKLSQLAGFEPTRAEPIGFQVQRLNHSATTALEMRGIEPRAFHMQSERSTTELHPLMSHAPVFQPGDCHLKLETEKKLLPPVRLELTAFRL